MEILVFLPQGQNLPSRKMVLAPRDGMVTATTALRRQVIQKLSSQKVVLVRLVIMGMETIVWSHEKHYADWSSSNAVSRAPAKTVEKANWL